MPSTARRTGEAIEYPAAEDLKRLPRYAELSALADLGLTPGQMAGYLRINPAKVRALLAYYGLAQGDGIQR